MVLGLLFLPLHQFLYPYGISYKGIDYNFVVGSKIGFTWEQLLEFTSDVKDMLREIIESPEVASHASVGDPFAQ